MIMELKLFKQFDKSCSLNINDIKQKIPKTAGVYVITAEQPFERLAGKDRRGILYIGEGQNLRTRIEQFIKDIEEKGVNRKRHSAGRTYRIYFRDNKDAKLKLNPVNFKVHWKSTKHFDTQETRLIKEYVKTFQDKPPLNISIKRKK